MNDYVLDTASVDEGARLAAHMPFWPETMKAALALPFVHSVTRPADDTAGVISINGVDRRGYELALSKRARRLELDLERTQKGERSADQEVERLQALLKDAEGLISTQMADINNLTGQLDAANTLVKRQREEIATLNKRVVTLKEQRSRQQSAPAADNGLPDGLTWNDAPTWADGLVRGEHGFGSQLRWARVSNFIAKKKCARSMCARKGSEASINLGGAWALIAKRPETPSQDDYEPPIPLSDVLRAAAPRELAEALTIAIKRD